jgi:hypothetical protein
MRAAHSTRACRVRKLGVPVPLIQLEVAMQRPLTLALALLAITSLAVACNQATDATSPLATSVTPVASHNGHGANATRPSFGPPSPEVLRDLARVRQVTARFHRIEVAKAANWDAKLTDCFSLPGEGGMGYHYGNLDLLFDGKVNVSEPELLLYEPQKNGKLELVAVEYAIPFTDWTGAEPPQLFGRPFHENFDFGLWILHVWVHRDNPKGMFEDWNPKVSCRHAFER